MLIQIDTREKSDFWKFESFLDVDTYISKIDTGDYILPDYYMGITIDRKKNLSELVKNLKEDRFKKELDRMKEYEEAYIICEFSYSCFLSYPINSGIPKNKWNMLKESGKIILDKVNQLEEKYNIPIVYLNNKYTAEECAYNLFLNFIKSKS